MKRISFSHYAKYAALIILTFIVSFCHAQSWQLWATGLQQGTYPRMTVAPNHDIFYTLVGAPAPQGIISKANTTAAMGSFTNLPAVPLPASHVNNINSITANINNEVIAGIYRNNMAESFMFRFDNTSQTWIPATCVSPPTLGAHNMITDSNGDIYMGARWAYVYKSTDNGNTFSPIDETAIIQATYPCYYPSYFGNQLDGAIFTINIDGNGRIYAGTESAGVVYSDDKGVTWHPADFNACLAGNPSQKDVNSPMMPLSRSGNVAGIGFTANNDVVWTGTDMWAIGWNNKLGFADMTAHTTTQALGIPNYLVQTGQQISKIVTASNGQMFFHSGNSNGTLPTDVGIYTSMDGLHWTQFNTGITGMNDGQSQGSLAVDGSKVFFATHDGKVFLYDVAPAPLAINDIQLEGYEQDLVNRFTWHSAQQGQIQTLQMQRSTNLIDWQTIDNIDKNTQTYEDKQPLQSAYYKLQIQDLNGQKSTSNMIHVARKNPAYPFLTLYPNPCTDLLCIKTYDGLIGEINISNPAGKIIQTITMRSNTCNLDVSTWVSGIYFIKIKNESGAWIGEEKFVKI